MFLGGAGLFEGGKLGRLRVVSISSVRMHLRLHFFKQKLYLIKCYTKQYWRQEAPGCAQTKARKLKALMV